MNAPHKAKETSQLLGSFSIRVGGSERVQIQFFAKYLHKYV